MRQKRLMLLGGLRYLKPVIEAAHQQGYYVITADNVPDNIAHKWSDEFCNVSIVEQEAVLKEAQRLRIDGIMSFACDPGVVSASYVQNRLGLPSFGPYESVVILQNKDRFRKFLSEHGFNTPQAKSFSSVEEALQDLSWYHYPVMVKPTDSAGSKGVTKVERFEALKPALERAIAQSISGHVIVEEFIEKRDNSSDTDSMSIDGSLVFTSFCAQRFDEKASNPYTPAAYSWPSSFSDDEEKQLTSEIQRLISLLNLKTVVYNIETRIGLDGKPYIMELTPRGGGNRLCEMIRYATGVDMITAITRAMVGDPIMEPIEQKLYNGHWAEVILHSDRNGIFDYLEIDDCLPAEVVEEDLWIKKGDKVMSFEGANNAIGTLVLRFNSAQEMEYYLNHQDKWLKINIQG